MPDKSLPYWLAALYCKNIGPRLFLNLVTQFSSIEKIFEASKNDLQNMGLNTHQINAIQSPNWQQVEMDLAWAQHSSHHLIPFNDERYPALLKEISDPPIILYLRGNKNAVSTLQLAIVGSRHATPLGLKYAEQFAASLIEAGLAITSGLALGVDERSHTSALSKNGITIAVMGTGVDLIYPRCHRKLAERIIDHDGALISEFPLSTPPIAMNFPRRNRIIAGLSVGVLVVEAALKSGSLITARHAIEAGREVFAIPGTIHNPLARGCHHLIRQGAKLVETYTDILEELNTYKIVSPSTVKKSNIAPLSKQNQEIFDQIDHEITSIDVIISRTGLTVSEVSSILLTLELDGYVESVQGGYIRK